MKLVSSIFRWKHRNNLSSQGDDVKANQEESYDPIFEDYAANHKFQEIVLNLFMVVVALLLALFVTFGFWLSLQTFGTFWALVVAGLGSLLIWLFYNPDAIDDQNIDNDAYWTEFYGMPYLASNINIRLDKKEALLYWLIATVFVVILPAFFIDLSFFVLSIDFVQQLAAVLIKWIGSLQHYAILGFSMLLTVSGCLLFAIRQRRPFWYGVAEFFVGELTIYYGLFALRGDFSNDDKATYLKIAAGLYILVRGLDNMGKGRPSSRFWRWLWGHLDPKPMPRAH